MHKLLAKKRDCWKPGQKKSLRKMTFEEFLATDKTPDQFYDFFPCGESSSDSESLSDLEEERKKKRRKDKIKRGL